MTIKHVTVECLGNKAIFADRFTLILNRYELSKEYSVPDMEPGESFTANCAEEWSLYMKSDEGFFAFGDVGPDVHAPALAIGFYVKDGRPTLMYPSGPPSFVVSDLFGYLNHPVTAIDGTVIVRYRWPASWKQERRIHIIASRKKKVLEWRVAPKSEPTIPEAPIAGGFTVTANGGRKGFGAVYERKGN
jgi:hypothetical protein